MCRYTKLFLTLLQKVTALYFKHPSLIEGLCDASSDPVRLRYRLSSMIWDIDSFLMDLHTYSWNPSENLPSAVGGDPPEA